MTLKEKAQRPTIAEFLAELKIIRESEPVEIDVPERSNRPDRFEEANERNVPATR